MRHGAARMQPHALRAPALINLPIALPNIPIISPIVTRLVAGINQQPTPTPTPTTPSISVTPTPGTGNTDTGSGNSGSGSETGSGSNSGSTDNSGTDSSGGGGDSGSGSGNSSGGGDSSSSSPSDSSTGSGSGSDTSSNSGNSSGGSSNNGSSSNPPAPNPGSNPGAPSVGAPSPVSTGKGSSPSSTTSANGAGNPTTTGGSSGTASLNTNVFANSNGTDTDDTSAGTLSGSTKPDYNGGAVNVGGQFTTTLGILPDTLPSNTHDGSSPTSGSGDVTSNDDGSGGFPIGAIIAIAVVSGLGLFFLLLFFLRRRSRSKRDQRNQWWFSNFSNDSLKWSDTNNSKNATVGTASQRSSFATSYDFATRSTLRSGGSIDIPVSPPMVEVRDTHTPGLMMHGSQTPSPLIISIEHTESRRASVHSDMSVSSDPYSQCIIIRDDKLLSGITTPMSVRPFSPSESFAFPKPPTSQNAGWAEDLKRASAGTTLKSTFESYTADPFADSPTLPVMPSSLEPVYRPFSPTLHDELGVEAGDLVNVVKVFDDGWILVEKVTAASAGGKGKFTAPGLIPIDCLRDERENLPEFLAAKRASGYSVGRASVFVCMAKFLTKHSFGQLLHYLTNTNGLPRPLTMGIHDLPLETIEEILLFADPIDLASLSQSSKLFAQLIYQQEDQRLWRWLYLIQELDDLRQCVYMDGSPRDVDSIDWKAELQAVVRARSILDNHRPNDRRGVLTTLVKLIECVPPLPTVSKNIVWVASYIADGTLLDRHGDQDETEEQLQAQLHTYYGRLPQDEFIASTVRSRAYVYDFRHYNWATDFGPFFEDGRINWVHLQAIQHTLSVHTHSDMNERPHLRMTLPSTQISLSDKEDWAGVSGNWQCGFCFCDHGSLTDFNRTDPPDVSFFEDPDNGDVCRSISVDLQIIQIAQDPKHPHHPRIYFGGNMGNQTSATMSGYVCMSDDNHVRWRFRSGEQLNPIWSSEGVQIGGLSSTYGVLGSWTTTFHDPLDPVGPFWLRKTIEQD